MGRGGGRPYGGQTVYFTGHIKGHLKNKLKSNIALKYKTLYTMLLSDLEVVVYLD